MRINRKKKVEVEVLLRERASFHDVSVNFAIVHLWKDFCVHVGVKYVTGPFKLSLADLLSVFPCANLNLHLLSPVQEAPHLGQQG